MSLFNFFRRGAELQPLTMGNIQTPIESGLNLPADNVFTEALVKGRVLLIPGGGLVSDRTDTRVSILPDIPVRKYTVREGKEEVGLIAAHSISWKIVDIYKLLSAGERVTAQGHGQLSLDTMQLLWEEQGLDGYFCYGSLYQYKYGETDINGFPHDKASHAYAPDQNGSNQCGAYGAGNGHPGIGAAVSAFGETMFQLLTLKASELEEIIDDVNTIDENKLLEVLNRQEAVSQENRVKAFEWLKQQMSRHGQLDLGLEIHGQEKTYVIRPYLESITKISDLHDDYTNGKFVISEEEPDYSGYTVKCVDGRLHRGVGNSIFDGNLSQRGYRPHDPMCFTFGFIDDLDDRRIAAAASRINLVSANGELFSPATLCFLGKSRDRAGSLRALINLNDVLKRESRWSSAYSGDPKSLSYIEPGKRAPTTGGMSDFAIIPVVYREGSLQSEEIQLLRQNGIQLISITIN